MCWRVDERPEQEQKVVLKVIDTSVNMAQHTLHRPLKPEESAVRRQDRCCALGVVVCNSSSVITERTRGSHSGVNSSLWMWLFRSLVDRIARSPRDGNGRRLGMKEGGLSKTYEQVVRSRDERDNRKTGRGWKEHSTAVPLSSSVIYVSSSRRAFHRRGPRWRQIWYCGSIHPSPQV